MRWLCSTIAVAMAILPSAAYSQADGESLNAVAARAGYSEQWLLPERELALFRPGYVIVIRPGSQLYEVNDRVEVADTSPRYINGDMIVSSSLANRLRRFAQTDPPREDQSARTPNFSGALAIEMQPLQGSESVTVHGQAPPGAPVTLTLLATISYDLPTILVRRHDVQTDVNGRFSAVLPIASDYFHASLLRVLATSTSGVTPATAQIWVDAPNLGEKLPADQWPPR